MFVDHKGEMLVWVLHSLFPLSRRCNIFFLLISMLTRNLVKLGYRNEFFVLLLFTIAFGYVFLESRLIQSWLHLIFIESCLLGFLYNSFHEKATDSFKA